MRGGKTMKDKFQVTLGVNDWDKMEDLFEKLAVIGNKIGFTMEANKEAQKVIDANTEPIKD